MRAAVRTALAAIFGAACAQPACPGMSTGCILGTPACTCQAPWLVCNALAPSVCSDSTFAELGVCGLRSETVCTSDDDLGSHHVSCRGVCLPGPCAGQCQLSITSVVCIAVLAAIGVIVLCAGCCYCHGCCGGGARLEVAAQQPAHQDSTPLLAQGTVADKVRANHATISAWAGREA